MNMKSYSHSLFGLNIQANCPIPGLRDSATDKSTDLQIWFGDLPAWFDNARTAEKADKFISFFRIDSTPFWELWQASHNGCWYLRYYNGIEFAIDRSGTQVWVNGYQDANTDEMFSYLVSLVMGIVLRLRNVVSLHAGAISIGDHAIALVGDSGMGKSTTVAAFAREGYTVASDEIVTLDHRNNEFYVHPAYPRIRLSDNSLAMLNMTVDTIDSQDLSPQKKYLDLPDNGFPFATSEKVLSAIYILRARSSRQTKPLFEPVQAKEGLLDLIRNSYPGHLLDRSMRQHELNILSKVVAQIPIRSVTPSDDPAQLTSLCEGILQDYRSLTPDIDYEK